MPARASVSSQVSQVPQGVTPPAQLVEVPATPTYSPDAVAVAVDLDDGAAARGARVVGEAVEVRDRELGAEGLAELVVVDQHGAAAAAPRKAPVPSWLRGVNSPLSSLVKRLQGGLNARSPTR